MPYNILALPLIAGFYLLLRSKYTAFRFQRKAYQELLVYAVLTGIIIALLSFVLRNIFMINAPCTFVKTRDLVVNLCGSNAPYTPHLITLLSGLFGTIVMVEVSNWLISKYPSYALNLNVRAIENDGDELEQLELESFLNGFPVTITLDTRKVYVAFFDETPRPKGGDFVHILPVLSGFRSSDCLRMELPVDYERVNYFLKMLGQDDKVGQMVMVIDRKRIVSATPFDIDVWSAFQATHELTK